MQSFDRVHVYSSTCTCTCTCRTHLQNFTLNVIVLTSVKTFQIVKANAFNNYIFAMSSVSQSSGETSRVALTSAAAAQSRRGVGGACAAALLPDVARAGATDAAADGSGDK